ncbi:hypothetical protein [Streptomyces violascens]|uniref:hypothetical protein n=1 Tax=Streptomyces violascens TaxID=67381 RepID=UPI001673AC65|nr:hypothetical protein [Streptomyces violascens]
MGCCTITAADTTSSRATVPDGETSCAISDLWVRHDSEPSSKRTHTFEGSSRQRCTTKTAAIARIAYITKEPTGPASSAFADSWTPVQPRSATAPVLTSTMCRILNS